MRLAERIGFEPISLEPKSSVFPLHYLSVLSNEMPVMSLSNSDGAAGNRTPPKP